MAESATGPGRRVATLAAAVAGALVCVLAGGAVAAAVDAALGVEFGDKTVLTSPTPAPPDGDRAAAAGPLAQAPTVSLPEGALEDPLLALAADQLGEALGQRTGEPAEVAEGLAGASVVAVLDPAAPLGREDFERGPAAGDDGTDPGDGTETGDGTEPGDAVVLTGADRRGLAAGLFRLGHDLRAGRSWAEATAPQVVVPATEHRFVDAGAVGVPVDVEAWEAQEDYSHASGALSQAVLDGEPWLDPGALAEIDTQWREYVDHVVGYGYNGIVVAGFLEYVTFAQVGDGTAVYPAGSAYVDRAEAMREQVGAMWAYADTMGLDVVLVTDMLALSGPLEAYLREETGGLDAGDERLWQVYGAGLDELLTELPFLDGVMLRIGEAGSIYNLEGWDYYSTLAVTRTDEVQAMLRSFTDVAAGHDADVFFRTWSVGVGDVGDLHTNPETYERVLGDVAPDNLVVSTKFVSGDYDSFLPLNPTLEVGEQPRLVELQARREFEAFSTFPNPVGGDHQAALQRVRDSGEDGGVDRLEGVWLWTQGGGPVRAGPLSLYLREGFWQLYDLDVWTTARLAWDPDADVGRLQADWVAATWASDPDARDALVELLGAGREATLDGLYVGPYAEQEVRAFGLEPPPMMWIFKWDLVSGDTASWSAVYAATAGRVDEAVAEGWSAVGQVEALQDRLDAIPADAFDDPTARESLAASLAYQQDLFTVLASYRETMLHYYEWVDTGSAESLAAHRTARQGYESAREAHLSQWTGNVDRPPFVFDNADAGLAVADRDAATAWLARVLLVVVAGVLVLSPAARGAVLTPWRGATVATGPPSGPAGARWRRPLTSGLALGALAAAALTVAHGGVTGFASMPYLATVAVAAAAYVAGYLATVGLTGGRQALGRALTAVAGATVLTAVPLLLALAWRGTTAAWSGFWLDPAGRTAFVVAHVALLLWCCGALAVAAARTARAAGAERRGAAVAAGAPVVGAGLAAGGVGAVAGSVGLERYLTVVNDAAAVLPFGLSRILGITEHLGIPTALPWWLLVAGLGVAAAVLLAALAARPAPTA